LVNILNFFNNIWTYSKRYIS